MKNENLIKTKKQALLFKLLGVTLGTITHFLLSRTHIFESLDFTETGQIGDTIGGISKH